MSENPYQSPRDMDDQHDVGNRDSRRRKALWSLALLNGMVALSALAILAGVYFQQPTLTFYLLLAIFPYAGLLICVLEPLDLGGLPSWFNVLLPGGAVLLLPLQWIVYVLAIWRRAPRRDDQLLAWLATLHVAMWIAATLVAWLSGFSLR